MIALSCGVKISAVHCLVLSQSTRATDGRTDGRTDRITLPRPSSIATSRGKILIIIHFTPECMPVELFICVAEALQTDNNVAMHHVQ